MAISCRSSSCGRGTPSWSPWCARPRTPRPREAWLRLGEAGWASGPSTAALPVATASSSTGKLRAARCVAKRAGSMLSGGPSPSCSTTPPFPLAPEASDVASRRLPRQGPRSRTATFARVKPKHRSKNDAEGGARAARLRAEGKRAQALPRRDRPPPAAERRRGGGPRQAGRARRCCRQGGDDQREPPPRRLDRQALSRPWRSLPRPDPGGHARLEPRGREVRLAAGLQVLDLRPLVDPPSGRTRDRKP